MRRPTRVLSLRAPPGVAAFLAGVLLWTELAAADPTSPGLTVPVELDVAAPDGCPDRETFLRDLQARSPRIRRAAPGEPAPYVRVEISTADGQTLGRLTVRQPDGEEGHREVRGGDCESVVNGMALIAAVVLDPSVALALPPSSTRVPEAPPARAPLAPDSAAPTAASSPVLSPRAHSPEVPVGLSFGIALEVATGLGPDPAVLPRASITLRFPAPLRGATVRMSVGHGLNRSVVTVDGTAEIELTNLRIEPCLDVWSFGSVQVGTCGIIEWDVLDGRGTSTNDAMSASRVSAELGLGLRPTWDVTRNLGLGLLAGGAVPLARYRFYFTAPDATAYRVGTWSGLVEFGADWRFW